MNFADLGLIPEILQAIQTAGYQTPTPIQQQAIAPALAGKDVLGCARTGTGKTAAFCLPLLQRVDELAGERAEVRALVLTPTRELAAQIGESLTTYGSGLSLEHAVIFGGVSENQQIKRLRGGLDILVATPGRLLDLMHRGFVRLDRVEMFVLDEADRMLDMGFIHDVRKVIAKLPRQRQTLLFSATMPTEIRSLASSIMSDPVFVSVSPVSSTADKIAQKVYFTDQAGKRTLLLELLARPEMKRTLVFSRTKHGANRVATFLDRGGIPSAAIHGNKSQNARTSALDGFRSGRLPVLVATDIAARGIDVDGVTHVINYDLPNIPETYVHRIGRTARAGAAGVALSFCDSEERAYLDDIERLIKMRLERAEGYATPVRETASADPAPRAAARGHQGGGRAGSPRSHDKRASGGRGSHEKSHSGQDKRPPARARSAGLRRP